MQLHIQGLVVLPELLFSSKFRLNILLRHNLVPFFSYNREWPRSEKGENHRPKSTQRKRRFKREQLAAQQEAAPVAVQSHGHTLSPARRVIFQDPPKKFNIPKKIGHSSQPTQPEG